MKAIVKKSEKTSRVQQCFSRCPDCHKNDGFYVVLVQKNGNKPGEYGVRLACPKCRRLFQLGLIVEEAAKKAAKKK